LCWKEFAADAGDGLLRSQLNASNNDSALGWLHERHTTRDWFLVI